MIWVGTTLATVGALLCLTAALGLVRVRDTLSRLAVVTKASTSGVLLAVAGAILVLPRSAVAIEGVVTAVFLMVVTPISGHLIGRAVYRSGDVGDLRIDELADGPDEARDGPPPADG